MIEKIIARFTPLVTYFWLALVFLTIIWKGIIPGWQKKPADFNNYYTAAKLVVDQKPIHQFYDYEWYQNKAKQMGIEDGAKFSPFPPITAYVFVPLTFWDSLIAKRIWLAINVFLLIILPFRIKEITAWHLSKAALFISLFLFPISSCLSNGQLYFVISFLLLEVFGQFYFQNKHKQIGVIIGIFAALKYIPIFFLGYAFKHPKKYTIIFTFILTVIIPNLIIYWIDPQSYSTFFQHFQSHLGGDLPGQGQYAIGFQSINSLLNNMFVFNIAENPTPFINLPILKPIIKFSLYGVILALIFLIFKNERYQITAPFVSIAIFGFFVLLPATASYHFLLLLWPLLSILRWLDNFNSRKKNIILTMVVFITFSLQVHHIPNFDKILVINLLLHYPRFWGLLSLFLLLILFYFKNHSKSYG